MASHEHLGGTFGRTHPLNHHTSGPTSLPINAKALQDPNPTWSIRRISGPGYRSTDFAAFHNPRKFKNKSLLAKMVEEKICTNSDEIVPPDLYYFEKCELKEYPD